MIDSLGSVSTGGQRTQDRLSGVVVTPARGGQREDSPHDAGDDWPRRACTLGAIRDRIGLEGLIDRLDDLPQCLAPGRSGSPLRATRSNRASYVNDLSGFSS